VFAGRTVRPEHKVNRRASKAFCRCKPRKPAASVFFQQTLVGLAMPLATGQSRATGFAEVQETFRTQEQLGRLKLAKRVG